VASFNPAKILRDHAETKKVQEEAIEAFTHNITTQYHSENIVIKKAERARFTHELNVRKLEAKVFMGLALEAGKSIKIFSQWEEKNIGNRGVKTLAEMQPTSSFSILLCIVRDFYAHDIAEHIPRARAVRIVIDEILFCP